MALSIGLFAHIFINSLVGQQAVEDKKIRRRLRDLINANRQNAFFKRRLTSLTTFNQVFSQAKWFAKLEELLKLTHLNLSVAGFIFFDFVIACILSFASFFMYFSVEISVFIFILAASIPYALLIMNQLQ